MNLDEAQRAKVAQWISEGLKLSEIQNRIIAEFGMKITYMEVRFLVDDLKLTPKDAEPPKAPAPAAPAMSAAAAPPAEIRPPEAAERPAAAGGVSVSVDQLARPGAVVSGKVTFSDGNKGEWYFDQTGRLALASQVPGYRPSQADLQQFQAALDNELNRMGF